MWRLSVVAVLLCGCAFVECLRPGGSTVSAPEPVEPVLVPDYNGVILPTEGLGEGWMSSETITGWWMPTVDDVRAMEAGLVDYLISQGEAPFWGEPVWDTLGGYHRQYGGILINDQPMLYTSFFCNNFGMDWAQGWLVVEDGGACFFGTLYDVTSGKFVELTVNGMA